MSLEARLRGVESKVELRESNPFDGFTDEELVAKAINQEVELPKPIEAMLKHSAEYKKKIDFSLQMERENERREEAVSSNKTKLF